MRAKDVYSTEKERFLFNLIRKKIFATCVVYKSNDKKEMLREVNQEVCLIIEELKHDNPKLFENEKDVDKLVLKMIDNKIYQALTNLSFRKAKDGKWEQRFPLIFNNDDDE